MTDKEIKRASDIYKKWTDAQLVEATTTQADQYLPEALQAIRMELENRSNSIKQHDILHAAADERRQNDSKRFTAGVLLFIGIIFINALLAIIWGVSQFHTPDRPNATEHIYSLVWGILGVWVGVALVRKCSSAPLQAKLLLWGAILIRLFSAATNHTPETLIFLVGPVVLLLYVSRSMRVWSIYSK